MQLYWQAKIWGVLHDPIFKALYDNNGRGGTGWWESLPAMKEWVALPDEQKKKLLGYVGIADQISSASDRSAIGNLGAETAVNYNSNGLEISHLLSGAKQPSWQTKSERHQQVAALSGVQRKEYLDEEASIILNRIPANIKNGVDEKHLRQLFWWLWRCLPAEACKLFDNDASLLLMPAETRLPDGSIWSHSSMTSALAGALIGYDTTMAEFQSIEPASKLYYNAHSHPYLVSFTFTPVQELIKASRKMRDFWAGSWILHYVSAHISYKLAQKYGADSLLYPSLFEQPLIDLWLRRDYPDLETQIDKPSIDSLLTAGFPNVLVLLVLPKAKVAAAMQFAEQELKQVWHDLSDRVFIVSLTQPHIRPIVRGKAGTPVEFGAKLSVSYHNGYVFVDRLSWDNFNESGDLKSQAEDFKLATGNYPESIHVDQIYRTKENRAWCKEREIRITGVPLGRQPKIIDKEKKKQAQNDEKFRSRIEGKFGEAKRRFSLGRVMTKLAKTSQTAIAITFLVMNLSTLLRQFSAFFCTSLRINAFFVILEIR